MKKVQHENSGTQKKCNMKQHETKFQYMKVQHAKKCNMKRVQDEE